MSRHGQELIEQIQEHNPTEQVVAEQRLLDFVADLIIDTARTHPRIRDLDVALWIARVALGANK